MSEVWPQQASARIYPPHPVQPAKHAPQDWRLLQCLQRVLADQRKRTTRDLSQNTSTVRPKRLSRRETDGLLQARNQGRGTGRALAAGLMGPRFGLRAQCRHFRRRASLLLHARTAVFNAYTAMKTMPVTSTPSHIRAINFSAFRSISSQCGRLDSAQGLEWRRSCSSPVRRGRSEVF